MLKKVLDWLKDFFGENLKHLLEFIFIAIFGYILMGIKFFENEVKFLGLLLKISDWIMIILIFVFLVYKIYKSKLNKKEKLQIIYFFIYLILIFLSYFFVKNCFSIILVFLSIVFVILIRLTLTTEEKEKEKINNKESKEFIINYIKENKSDFIILIIFFVLFWIFEIKYFELFKLPDKIKKSDDIYILKILMIMVEQVYLFLLVTFVLGEKKHQKIIFFIISLLIGFYIILNGYMFEKIGKSEILSYSIIEKLLMTIFFYYVKEFWKAPLKNKKSKKEEDLNKKNSK